MSEKSNTLGYKVSTHPPTAHKHALAAYKNEDGRDQPHHSEARYKAVHGPFFSSPEPEDAPTKKITPVQTFVDDAEPGDTTAGGYRQSQAVTKRQGGK